MKQRTFLAPLLLITALVVSSCSTGKSDGTNNNASPEAEVVKLTVIPIVDVAPVYLGVEKGFFAEEGISLELTEAQGGAAIVPSVIGGSSDIGFGNNTSTLLAASRGLPLEVIASGVYSNGDEESDYVQLLTKTNSRVMSPKDLEGKTVAVNTLRNLGDTSVRSSVEKAGGDPSTVKFVEIPFPDMTAALDKGNVDAVWQVEPFITISGLSGDYRTLSSPLVDVKPNLMVSSYFTTHQFAAENPQLLERFKTAIDRSLEYAQDNPDEARAIMVDYLGISAEAAENLILPVWKPEIDRETFEVLSEAGVGDESLEKVDLDALLP